jgi:hypothetical protein
MKIPCAQCKGRGTVFNPMSLMLTIGLPIAMLMDSQNDDGMTRKECPTCDGYGYFDCDRED